MSDPAEHTLTIDELARRTSMTTRNVRAYQTRGLIPPPDRRGQVAYYGTAHVTRLELIKKLQANGLALDLIRRLLDEAGGSDDALLRFAGALSEPFSTTQRQVLNVAELTAYARSDDPSLLRDAVSQGFLRPAGKGQYEAVNDRLVEVAAELHQQNMPIEEVMRVATALRAQTDDIARMLIESFLRTVWTPYEAAGRPAEGWPRVEKALKQLRSLAPKAVLGMLELSLDAEVERAFKETIAPKTDG